MNKQGHGNPHENWQDIFLFDSIERLSDRQVMVGLNVGANIY